MARDLRSLNTVLWCLLLAASSMEGQVPTVVPPGSQLQLQVAQPTVDNSSPVTATAEFDPPLAQAGQKVFYRVNVDAAESSIGWPDEIPTPAGLNFSRQTRGMITQTLPNGFRPLTSFLYEVEATNIGQFTAPNFTVAVGGALVNVPAATLRVMAANSGLPPPRQLAVDMTATNVFLGQPFRVRVMLPAGPGNQMDSLREVQFSGNGLMADKTSTRQAIETVNLDGTLKSVFVCEMVVTPIAAGPLKFFAQGFTAGREFTAPITIQGQVTLAGGPPKYQLLVSDLVEIRVRPVPLEGELPGFTGAIGDFFHDPPQLSTNRLRVGEPVQLKIVFHGKGEMNRMVPPIAPRSQNWQIIADPPPATSFTLIPQSDEEQQTPAIPFSYFDPSLAKFVDLSIPSLPVTIIGEGLPAELPLVDDGGKPAARLKLSAMAELPGREVSGLKPLQMQPWFVGLQVVPVAGFLALWQWDRRRRFLEANPDIVRRAQARRALRREQKLLQKAEEVGDITAFVHHAARAMSIAVAPDYPANPQALVGGDVLARLDESSRNGGAGETVRIVFAAVDAQFAGKPPPPPDLAALRHGVATVLQQLEARL